MSTATIAWIGSDAPPPPSGYTQDFNALTTGTLAGQDSWTGGGTEVQVQTSVVYEGAKAVSLSTAFDPTTQRIFDTPISSGSFYVAIRKSHTTNGVFAWTLKSGTAGLSYIRMGTDGNLSAYDDSFGYRQLVTGFAADTWYVVNVEFDDAAEPDKYRARAHNGTSWSSFTVWMTGFSAYSTIDRIEFETTHTGVASTCYFDTITDTDPT